FKPCAHHVKESDYQACPTVRAAVTANCHETSRDFCQDTYSTPSCSSNCHNQQYGTPFDQDRYYTDDYFPSRFGDAKSIKQEIMTNGPVWPLLVIAALNMPSPVRSGVSCLFRV
ncbi:hypothetical protein FOZ62_022220, partial [Perkinsus olseni]